MTTGRSPRSTTRPIPIWWPFAIELQAIWDEWQVTLDADRRQELATEAQTIYQDNQLAVWLWHRAYIHAFQPRLKDYRLTRHRTAGRARQGLDRGVAAESGRPTPRVGRPAHSRRWRARLTALDDRSGGLTSPQRSHGRTTREPSASCPGTRQGSCMAQRSRRIGSTTVTRSGTGRPAKTGSSSSRSIPRRARASRRSITSGSRPRSRLPPASPMTRETSRSPRSRLPTAASSFSSTSGRRAGRAT